MNTIEEALNTLISAANVAHSKGVYSMEETHYIYMAISYLNSLQPEQAPAAEEKVVEEPQSPEAPEAPQAPDSPQGY